MKKYFNIATLAYVASSALAAFAVTVVNPYSAYLVHQPEVPAELKKK